jgi:hypothetical protein
MEKKSQRPTLVTEIDVVDPATGQPVALEIWKAPNGALFGIDATYLDQVRDTGIPSPFDDGETFDMTHD